MSEPAVPIPLTILDQLNRELTVTLMDRVRKYARRRVGAKRRAGLPCFDTDTEAELLAQDAATATILGHRAWEPSVPLFEHLCGAVRSMSSAEIRNHRRKRTRALVRPKMDESNDGDAALDALIAKQGHPATARPRHQVSVNDALVRLLGALRVVARGDRDVSLLLDAYEAGVGPEDRATVLLLTDLTKDAYRNARRRLDRMIESLPANLSEGTHDALEVSYGY